MGPPLTDAGEGGEEDAAAAVLAGAVGWGAEVEVDGEVAEVVEGGGGGPGAVGEWGPAVCVAVVVVEVGVLDGGGAS